MPRRGEKDVLVYAVAAAYLRGTGMLQKGIADALGINQPDVSRYLKDAEERGWLRFLNPEFVHPVGDERQFWDEANAKFFTNPSVLERLKERFPEGAARLRRVTVLHGEAKEEIGEEKEEIHLSVVDTIRTLLSDVDIVGVTWGRTINRLVATLRTQITVPPRSQNPIQFVPLCGEPLKDRSEPIKYSSSALSVQMSLIFNGRDQPPPPSLAGVPAFIPSQFKATGEVRTIRRFLRQVAGYAAVLGDEGSGDAQGEPLVNRVGAILTSVGVVDEKYRGIFLQERVQIGDVTEKDLKDSVIGDMGGVIIPRRDLTREQERRINVMNDRWTGIKQTHIEHCAGTATAARPGVIVLALGVRRCKVVMRCVELGLVNELIVDQETAKALEGAATGHGRRRP